MPCHGSYDDDEGECVDRPLSPSSPSVLPRCDFDFGEAHDRASTLPVLTKEEGSSDEADGAACVDADIGMVVKEIAPTYSETSPSDDNGDVEKSPDQIDRYVRFHEPLIFSSALAFLQFSTGRWSEVFFATPTCAMRMLF